MLPRYLNEGKPEHWAVNVNCRYDSVLLQIADEYGSQVRIQLTPEQVEEVIQDLQHYKEELIKHIDNRRAAPEV